jgi:hypothetical protein
MPFLPLDAMPAPGTVEKPEVSRAEPASPLPYERPCLEFMGSLSNLLGKSGTRSDYTYRRANSGRP